MLGCPRCLHKLCCSGWWRGWAEVGSHVCSFAGNGSCHSCVPLPCHWVYLVQCVLAAQAGMLTTHCVCRNLTSPCHSPWGAGSSGRIWGLVSVPPPLFSHLQMSQCEGPSRVFVCWTGILCWITAAQLVVTSGEQTWRSFHTTMLMAQESLSLAKYVQWSYVAQISASPAVSVPGHLVLATADSSLLRWERIRGSRIKSSFGDFVGQLWLLQWILHYLQELRGGSWCSLIFTSS